MRGRVHSFETLGALDGPGLRTVVFLQGCPLRCAFCHNPDTWAPEGGRLVDADEVIRRVLRFRPYYGARGGVTLSGGEPLLQPAFAQAVLAGCRAEGVHTALDTSGCVAPERAAGALEAADLVLLDVKATEDGAHRRLTGAPRDPVLRFLDAVRERGIPVWIRTVVLPGENDTPDAMRRLARLLGDAAGIERVELLPYHTMAAEKYAALGLETPLPQTPALAPDRLGPLAGALREALPDGPAVVAAESPPREADSRKETAE